MVGLLTAALTGTNAPWEVQEFLLGSPAAGAGRFGSLFIVIDPASFVERQAFLDSVDAFIDGVKSAPRRPEMDEILYPGEKSQRLRGRGIEREIVELPVATYEALRELADELELASRLAPLTQ
jgi:LDH2 family malate/lactate/ureidoglycolate dehydrogenase